MRVYYYYYYFLSSADLFKDAFEASSSVYRFKLIHWSLASDSEEKLVCGRVLFVGYIDQRTHQSVSCWLTPYIEIQILN